MEQPPAAPDDRPPVPVGDHRRARRERRIRLWCWWGGWALMGLSVLLAIFVHRGLLGIAALVGAAAVAYVMLHPRNWLWRDDEDEGDGDRVTESPAE